MPNAPLALDRHLEALITNAREGQRLPTVRSLMREFGVSQMVVQRAFQALKGRGLISAHVGRGTYFLTGADPRGVAGPVTAPASMARATSARARSVLLLRRTANTTRGRTLAEVNMVNHLVRDLTALLQCLATDFLTRAAAAFHPPVHLLHIGGAEVRREAFR